MMYSIDQREELGRQRDLSKPFVLKLSLQLFTIILRFLSLMLCFVSSVFKDSDCAPLPRASLIAEILLTRQREDMRNLTEGCEPIK